MRREPSIIYLAYVDDSGLTNQYQGYAVFAAAIVHHSGFKILQAGSLLNADLLRLRHQTRRLKELRAELLAQGRDEDEEEAKAQADLIDQEPMFSEFKARDLFLGEGDFKSIPQDIRFEAIKDLIESANEFSLHIIYGAVEREAIKKTAVASVNCADVAFRKCISGIEKWLKTRDSQLKPEEGDFYNFPHLCLVVLDECQDGLKKTLRETYREMAKPEATEADEPTISDHSNHLPDAIYFGSSSDSGFSLQIYVHFLSDNI
jgi:hypothetical protein